MGKSEEQDPLVGSWLSTGSPIVAELLASTGLDFLCVDVEHSAVDVQETQRLFQAIRSGSPACLPFVRLPGISYADPKRYVDAGAKGVIAPLVNCREDAETIVRSVKYPPLGDRGVGFCRANGYGSNLEEHFACSNGEVMVIVQIEHIEAVENIDEILSVEGVDGVFIGPYDLSASMGLTAQFEHPEYLSARDRILASCREHGITPGIHVVQPSVSQVKERLADGYRLIAYSLDITVLLETYTEAMRALRH